MLPQNKARIYMMVTSILKNSGILWDRWGLEFETPYVVKVCRKVSNAAKI
jgi:hypothetical protein